MRWVLIFFGVSLLGLSGCPEMTVAPGEGPQGARNYELVLTGQYTHWSTAGTQVEFPVASGIEVVDFVASTGTDATLLINIPLDEPVGPQVLRLTTGSEESEADFVVTAGPTVWLTPSGVEQYESGQRVLIEGTDTSFAALGFGVTVDIVGVTVVGAPNVLSDTQAEVFLDTDMSAAVGVYSDAFLVTTDWQTVALDFEITPVQGRYMTLDPVESYTGEIVKMAIYGVKTFFDDPGLTWEGMFDIDLWDGLEVVEHKVVSASELYVELWVDTLAAHGIRTITVTDTWGPLAAQFEVLFDASAPTVSFDPASARPREDPMVVATGVNTSFSASDPATTVEVNPPGVGLAVMIDYVEDATTVHLLTIVELDAEIRDYEVTFHTGPEHVTGIFTVEDLPVATIDLSHTSGQQLSEIPNFEITGTNTHFEANGVTVPEVSGGGGVILTEFVVVNESLATATLVVSETAAPGPHTITMRTDFWNETPSATFTVEAGDPSVTLSPNTVNQGDEDVTITATGHFVGWDSTTTVVSSNCGLTIVMGPVTGPGALTFDVSVPLFHIPKVCDLVISGDGQPTVVVQMTILSTSIDPGTLPWDDGYYLDGPDRFSIMLEQGDVIKARAKREIWSSIDLVLGVYAGGSSIVDPLIENDDESAATVDALVVFQAPETGMYFLYVRERWSDSFTGDYRLLVDYYVPTSLQEMSTITDPDSNDDSFHATLLGAAGSSWYIRGEFQTANPADTSDFYRVSDAAGIPLALQIVARDVSPADISTAEVSVVLYGDDITNVLTPTIYSHEGVDPMMYVSVPSNFANLFIEVVRAPGSPVNTTYWLNVRPALVINEVMFDHDNDFYGSFVELHGEPFASLANCELVLEEDGVPAPPIALTDSLSALPYSFTEYGYLVVAHDSGTPGVGPEHIKEELVFTAAGIDQAVQLWCNGVLIDAVQYRGSTGGGGENNPAVEPPSGKSLGRGFHADSDDNANDFMEQIEPSPWMRNLTEVRR